VVAAVAVAVAVEKAKARASKGGKGRGCVSPAVDVATKHVYGEGANFFDERAEWLSQWPDPAERKKHCFLGEKLAVECSRQE
jgi:hypothetical protein